MSGRSGYRKTDRKVLNRTAPADMPPFRLALVLPANLAFAVAPGPTGIVGVSVEAHGIVTATGANAEWVLRQVSAFLAKISNGQEHQLVASLERAARGEGDRPERFGHDVLILPRPSIVVVRKLHKAIITPIKA